MTPPEHPEDTLSLLLDASLAPADRLARLLPLVYDELRAEAQRLMRSERDGHTLQATALLHEAYLKLVGPRDLPWQNRAHFFAAAAEAMRRILVERARSRARLRHGGAYHIEELDPEVVVELPQDLDLLALDEALARLEREDPPKAELVKLRYFAGLTLVEAAEVLGISRATADRRWAFARAWLFREVSKGDAAPGEATPETYREDGTEAPPRGV